MDKIGKKVKELRQKKNLALKELAARTKLTSSFLSQLEKGMTLPSLPSLCAIASALEVKVGAFFDENEPREIVYIRRRKKIEQAVFGPTPHYEVLASSVLHLRILPLLLKLEPGQTLSKEACPLGREMLGIAIEGEISVGVNGKEFNLVSGDSLYLVDPKFEYLKNSGSSSLIFLWAVLRADS